MKILILTPTEPLPAINGARIRMFNFIKQLSQNNFITLISLTNKGGFSDDIKRELKKYCQTVIEVYHSKPKPLALLYWLFSKKPYRHVKMYNSSFSQALSSEFKNKYDVVLCNFLDMAQYIKSIVPIKDTSLFALDQHNADELWFTTFTKSDSILVRYFGNENLRRLKNIQEEDYKHFDICMSVSEQDATMTINSLIEPPQFMVSPNGVDLDYFKTKSTVKSQNNILFCGSMDTYMNQDAVLYFHRDILPLIKQKIPDVHLIIVGRNPSLSIKRLKHDPNVTVTGTVNDVRPFYENAKLLIAPFRFGGGTKLKILEAMAMKVPVISTSTGCQGIDIEENRHILIADNRADFATMVIDTLITCPTEMIKQAYTLVYESYSWINIINKVEQKFYNMSEEMKINSFHKESYTK